MEQATMETKASLAPLLFLLLSVICQTLALALLVIGWSLTSSLWVAILSGCLAGGAAARILSLSLPWQVLNLILPSAIASSFIFEVPSSLFLALFVITVLIYLPAFWTRVPYYPTPRAAYALVLSELPTDQHFEFIDLGSGMGDMLVFLAKRRPQGSFTGIEIGIVPFLASLLRARVNRTQNVRICFQSMWSTNLVSYDFVYAFLSPAPMMRLWEKVVHEMKQGSLFISNTFAAPSEPSSVVAVKDARQSSLYLYRR